MSINVVLTGAAYDHQGNPVLRANLIHACGQRNIRVQTGVRSDTNILVASRMDTVKAAKAQAAGISVVSYPDFIKMFLNGEIETISTEKTWVDYIPKAVVNSTAWVDTL